MDMKKHGFWVAIGVGFALALGLYVVLIPMGVGAQTQTKERELKRAVGSLSKYARIPDEEAWHPLEGLPTREAVTYWEQKQALLKEELEGIKDRYRKLDASLEKITGGHDADPSHFHAEINRDIKKLDKDLEALLPEGKSFVDIVPVFGAEQLKDVEQIPQVQKRFYLGEALALAALAAGAEELVRVTFDDMPAPIREEDRGKLTVRRLGATAELLMPAPGHGGDKGKRRRLGALRQLDLDEESPPGLPALLSALLKHRDLVFTIESLKVAKTEFAYPELDPWKVFGEKKQAAGGFAGQQAASRMKSFEQDVYIATQNTDDPEAKTPPPPITEPPVKVELKVNVLDFHIPEGES